jgi:hypothetical protein
MTPVKKIPEDPLMLTNEHSGHAHARTNAHTRNENPSASLFGNTQSRSNLTSTRASKGVTNSNGTTINVYSLVRNLKAFNRIDGLASESLINLEEINFILSDANELENARNGKCWADTHDARWNANDSGFDIFAKDRKTKALCHRAAGEDDCRSAIRHL